MKLSILDIVKITKGSLIQGEANGVADRICTDTRKMLPGDLYVALQGPRFDGHDFVQEALSRGAMGALISRRLDLSIKACQIIVPNTLKALGDIALFWREQFKIPIIGITGSSGKTTTKEMVALCLEMRGSVHKTEGNLNNLIGLPLTLLSLKQDHQFAICEMGMNAFGEIARLTEIAKPTIGLITNVGRAHLEGVETQEGVATAKSELFAGLNSRAQAVVNLDDPFISRMKTGASKLTYGFHPSAQIRCEKVEIEDDSMRVIVADPRQTTTFKLPVVGDHYVSNWLGCYAICYLLGITPAEAGAGIAKFRLTQMRGEMCRLRNDLIVINDAYNANPDSMRAALKTLALRFRDRRKIAVLGEMFELGKQSKTLHEQLGKMVAESGIKILFTFGSEGEAIKKGFLEMESSAVCYEFQDMESLTQKLEAFVKPQDVILVKGSRGAKMERVINFLKERH